MGTTFKQASEEAVTLGVILAESKRREASRIERKIVALYAEIAKLEQVLQQQG
ncbi:hypothetical protein [Brochothrix campestris]|uniref:hypothetical protein n=1 Tax=Brochothrix campestris TaxID=2757 RepID=UPI0004B73665|nr:hypothetical protein [Brochothrix campestris]